MSRNSPSREAGLLSASMRRPGRVGETTTTPAAAVAVEPDEPVAIAPGSGGAIDSNQPHSPPTAPDAVRPDRAPPTGRPINPASAHTTGHSHLKRTIWIGLSLFLLVALLIGSFFGYRYLDNMINYVTTDNAQVTSQNVPIGSMNAGRVASLRVDVGAQVHTGDVLAEIELPSAVRTLQNGAPDLEYLGAADQRTQVVSPMNGLVVSVPAAIDQTVTQGQPVVVLMDPARLWINANVDENHIARVRVGQTVEAYVAAADKTVSGRVSAITPATAASFLPTPPANATGDYTNPGQLVPVKISVDDRSTVLFVGATAQVKIRVT